MSLSKKAKTRILKLCDFMEALPKEASKHFDMWWWVHHSGDHQHKLPKILRTRDILHTCGTTACAAGFAATMPYFKRLGLSLTKRGHLFGDLPGVFDTGSITSQRAYPDLFAAVNDDRTPKQWARRVRKLVRQWEAQP